MSTSQGDREFTRNLLKYGYGNSLQTTGNDIRIQGLGRTFSIPRRPTQPDYTRSAPPWILPVTPPLPGMTDSTGNVSAATAYQGKDYRTFVMGFPFESIEEEADRNAIMASILQFLGERKK